MAARSHVAGLVGQTYLLCNVHFGTIQARLRWRWFNLQPNLWVLYLRSKASNMYSCLRFPRTIVGQLSCLQSASISSPQILLLIFCISMWFLYTPCKFSSYTYKGLSCAQPRLVCTSRWWSSWDRNLCRWKRLVTRDIWSTQSRWVVAQFVFFLWMDE